MVKDLVVNLTLEAARDPAAEFALSIASAFEAHVAATAPAATATAATTHPAFIAANLCGGQTGGQYCRQQ